MNTDTKNNLILLQAKLNETRLLMEVIYNRNIGTHRALALDLQNTQFMVGSICDTLQTAFDFAGQE